MSLAVSNRQNTYTGNDVTTDFAYTWRLILASYLNVYVIDLEGNKATLVLDTDYTVGSLLSQSGGDITLIDDGQDWIDSVGGGLKDGYKIVLVGAAALNQTTDIRNQGSYFPSLHEDAFDKLTMIAQEQAQKLKRSVLHKAETGFEDKEFPTPEEDSVLVWDGDGNLINLSLASIAAGTYTGSALKYPSLTLTLAGATVVPSDATYSFIYSSGATAKTITLPSAASVGVGRFFFIAQDGNATAVTVQRSGSDTLDGATSINFAQSYNAYLFVSNGVDGWAATNLKQQQVQSANIANSAVGTTQIATSAVTTAKIADSNVTTLKIADLNVTTSKIATGAVTAEKITPTLPTIQRFTSGSGTYTTPAGVKRIVVKAVGGGGGGGGSTGNGGTGGSTTFGTSLLTAAGGSGGQAASGGAGVGGSGGACTINSPAVTLVSVAGGLGGGCSGANATPGGGGGVSFYGGNAPVNLTIAGAQGLAAAANSGSGGSGLSGNAAATPARGGGAGGYLEAIINAPDATYAYAVGTGGSSGSGGNGGGAGGSGLIVVEEYYY